MNSIPTTVGRRQLLVGLVVAPLAAVALVACGDKEEVVSDTGASVPVTSAPATSDSPTTEPPATEPPTTPPPATEPGSTEPPATDPVSTTPPTGVDYPKDASVAVIKLVYEGGFVPAGADFAAIPPVLISGEGKSYAQGVTTAEYPGPLVRPVAVRDISDAGIRTLLAAAQEAGLLGRAPDYTGKDNVTDVPYTVLTITTTEGTFVHRAYALGMENDDGSESTEARRNLLEFVELLQDLEGTVGADALGDETLLEPETYRLVAFPVDETSLEGIEPEPTIADWPDDAGVALRDADECTAVDADAVGSLLARAKENTFFREGDGETATLYQVAVRPQLPGDEPC